MKSRFLAIALALGTLAGMTTSQAAEVTFNPSTQWYDMDGNGTLRLWAVPEANGNALAANPDYDWPKPAAIAAWYATLLKAQQMGLSVGIGYDPATLDIWYVARPR